MKHTKSPSGRTHRLTERNGDAVTIRYQTTPQFDDQVQGDLVRKWRDTYAPNTHVGILPVFVDAALLDRGQTAPSLDYLKGYLAGLETADRRHSQIATTQQQIAKLEHTHGH